MPASIRGSVPELTRTAGDADRLEVLRAANDELELAFLPGVGGRLISLRCGGTELLWRNPEYLDVDLGTVRPRTTWAPLTEAMGSWANVGGSKTWPAPQGWGSPDEWPGPPDGVLDSGRWTVSDEWSEELDGLVVRLTSPDDARTGLRVERRLVVPRSGTTVRQRNTFTNVSDRPVRWSVWEVCQVDTEAFAHQAGGSVDVGSSGSAAPISMVESDGAIDVGPVVDGFRVVQVSDVVAKVGFTDATGCVRYRRPDGAGIDLVFPVEPDAVYPDGGCQVELWMQYPTAAPIGSLEGLHPSARLVELEILSPLHELAPGASASFDFSWTVHGPSA